MSAPSPLAYSHPVEAGLRDVLGALVPPGVPLSVDLTDFPRLPLMLELLLLRLCYELAAAALRGARPTAWHVRGRREGAGAVLELESDDAARAIEGVPARLQRTLEALGGTLVVRRGAGVQLRVRLPA